MKNYRKKNTLLLVILLVLTFSMIFISLLFPEKIIVHDSFDHGSVKKVQIFGLFLYLGDLFNMHRIILIEAK